MNDVTAKVKELCDKVGGVAQDWAAKDDPKSGLFAILGYLSGIADGIDLTEEVFRKDPSQENCPGGTM